MEIDDTNKSDFLWFSIQRWYHHFPLTSKPYWRIHSREAVRSCVCVTVFLQLIFDRVSVLAVLVQGSHFSDRSLCLISIVISTLSSEGLRTPFIVSLSFLDLQSYCFLRPLRQKGQFDQSAGKHYPYCTNCSFSYKEIWRRHRKRTLFSGWVHVLTKCKKS